MTAGYAQQLVDVDLMLKVEDAEPCMLLECSAEAVWHGIISTPCGCPQPLCLADYERERPRWSPGDSIHCYMCPKSVYNGGEFVRWERIRRW